MPKSVIVKLSQIVALSGVFLLSGCAGSGGVLVFTFTNELV
ncbi:hypothetical protein PY546_10430 [Providencia stuartii]|nr:hypothetical protein [Providencia stuartii]